MRSVGRAEFNTEGIATRFIGIVQDITERKLMEAELKRSNADLEQFAYAVSHDMRQPLRMVTSYLTLIENALEQQLNEEQQQFLNFAIDGAKRMDAMILSLLDYSRVGHKNANIHQVSSRAALNEALSFLEPELQASGGSIEISGEWIDITLNGDELTRLLQNLIGNALKYHEKDQPPCVEVSARQTKNVFKVAVCDHGIGIDNQQFAQLFKVFSRLQPRSRFEGTGVGLALCRRIVEYYGGKIGVESAGEGQGSVFWFELPIMPTSIELEA
jgi:signal transduction histidine kinase